MERFWMALLIWEVSNILNIIFMIWTCVVSGVSGVSNFIGAGASCPFWKDLIGALVPAGGFPRLAFSFPWLGGKRVRKQICESHKSDIHNYLLRSHLKPPLVVRNKKFQDSVSEKFISGLVLLCREQMELCAGEENNQDNEAKEFKAVINFLKKWVKTFIAIRFNRVICIPHICNF